MARKIRDIVVDANGIRISWSDNRTDQCIWKVVNGQLSLQANGGQMTDAQVNEIINAVTIGVPSTRLWSHLFGVSGDHISASALGQIGTSLAADTWTRMIWDNIELEARGGLAIDVTTGIITLSKGQWDITGQVQFHKTSASSIEIMIQVFDESNQIEVPRTFRIRSTSTKVDSPTSIRVSSLLDTIGGDMTTISIRVRVNASDAVFGSIGGDIPAGSENTAGLMSIKRIG